MKRITRLIAVGLLLLLGVSLCFNSTSVSASVKSSAAKYLKGTWATNSFGEWGGDFQPQYYIIFTKKYVKYGHASNGEFVLDHKDKIIKVEKVKKNCYRIKVKNSKGYKYMFKNRGKKCVDYYGTWKKSKMKDTYSGGASLTRAEIPTGDDNVLK